ncbi:LTA synthase family protein [Variovorax sp. J22P240]|uniref:LTA synthase family protein n=1 Tax=Variovorax sp. J22P240 TaxID=3053514 RepID=UPI002574969F|nr:LTA synthase family protein [Variovorax sp. J22P240]MDM0002774.1 LTA synthase family protein [Variovorax sp. J22P240]
MGHARADLAERQSGKSPWMVAWLLLAPLAIWLLLAKAATVMAGFAWLGLTLDESGPVAFLRWAWAFTAIRFVMALLLAHAVQRLLFPRHRLMTVPIAAAIMSVLALAVALVRPEQIFLQVLTHWTTTAGAQFWMVIACAWNDAVSIAILTLVLGLVLTAVPARAQAWLVRAMQVLVVLLCGLVGLVYAYELATGQPSNSRVLIFSVLNAQSMASLVAPEVTPFRVAAIAGGILLAIWWAWRKRALARIPLHAGSGRSYAGLGATLATALGVFVTAPVVELSELERHTEGTLIALVRTVAASPSDEIRVKVLQEYDTNKRARWSSAEMKLVETDQTRRKNVVVVILESARAISTTLHTARLPTTPFLNQLAEKSLVIEDMNIVVPRTAAAWVAVLGGQYPLTNEGTAIWAAENAKTPRLRGLPGALRDAGYATSFFTPTHLRLLNDAEVLDALGFESIFAEEEVTPPNAKRVNSSGPADEVLIEPVLAWTAIQKEAGRPFMTAIMTNVGHHPYETPASWTKVKFEGVSNPALEAYYNCLLYIDHIMASLMRGYERLGVLYDTIFVFVGDHGQMFGEHGLKQMFNALYQEGLHVPAFIYAPGLLPQHRKIEGPRQQIDIVPTIVELLGYRLEGAVLPGVSLLQPVGPNRKLYFSSSIEWTYLALRQGQRKYIYSFNRYRMKVFDLANDPSESHALKGVSADEFAAAQQEMLEWKAHREVSMYGRPTQTYRRARSWKAQ